MTTFKICVPDESITKFSSESSCPPNPFLFLFGCHSLLGQEERIRQEEEEKRRRRRRRRKKRRTLSKLSQKKKLLTTQHSDVHTKTKWSPFVKRTPFFFFEKDEENCNLKNFREFFSFREKDFSFFKDRKRPLSLPFPLKSLISE